MKDTQIYREHAIDLDITTLAPDRVRWTYFVDNAYCYQGISSLGIDEARAAVLVRARLSIDALVDLVKNDPVAVVDASGRRLPAHRPASARSA